MPNVKIKVYTVFLRWKQDVSSSDYEHHFAQGSRWFMLVVIMLSKGRDQTSIIIVLYIVGFAND